MFQLGFNKLLGVATLATGTLTILSVWGTPVQATLLSNSDTALVLNATIPDGDLFLLSEFFGFQANEFFDYKFDIDNTGWSATLSGVYLGKNLNITYSGDTSTFPSGNITWTTSGFFGSDTWSGNGTALITDTGIGFDIDFDSSLTVGTNLGAFNQQINVLVDSSVITPVETFGTTTVNGTVVPVPTQRTWLVPKKPKVGDKVFNDYEKDGKLIIESCYTIKQINGERQINGEGQITGEGQIGYGSTPPSQVCKKVPESSPTLNLLALGTLGAASTLKRKLKPSKSTEKKTTKVG